MTTQTPEILCPDCGYSVLAHTEGVPTWPSGMYLLWERVCTLTPGQALAKWIAQDRAETRRAVFGEIACSVCWSVSWAPCGADEPGAVKDPQDPSGEKYMFCQLCAAEQRTKEARRAALLEAAFLACQHCRDGRKVTLCLDGGFGHWVEPFMYGCLASDIHARIAKLQAQDQACGEGADDENALEG